MADTVEKVENRGAPKISRISNVGDLSRCKALRNQIRASVVAFALIDLVTHIAARETHERSLGFSVISQKGLFQHNRRIADIPAPGSLRAAHAAIQTAATKTSIGRGWSIT